MMSRELEHENFTQNSRVAQLERVWIRDFTANCYKL